VSVELVGRGLLGRQKPRLVAHVHAPLAGLRLELARSDGKAVRLTAGKLANGATKAFDLDQPEGTFHYEGRLVATFAKALPSELPLSFDASLFGPPPLTAGDDAVDLAARTVTFTLGRAPGEVNLRVLGDDGALLAEVHETYTDRKAGEPIVLTWQQPPTATVLRLDLRAADALGYYQELVLSPWRVELPHEDVLFDSGQSAITDGERPKLDAAYGELTKALQRYGKLATVQLFITGFTDTVGDAGANETLSAARALAIARWFRAKGVRLGIHHAGLGERGLLVATPDETAEAQNRRATYTLAIEPPRGVRWTKLP
jgi:outer membrane protein OmpA-like peptidoglycan-associated protein